MLKYKKTINSSRYGAAQFLSITVLNEWLSFLNFVISTYVVSKYFKLHRITQLL